MTSENLEDLVQLFADVDRTYFHHATRASAEQFLSRAGDSYVLGRLNGKVVAFGMLTGWHEGFAVPSLGIAVKQGYEGSGHGRTMMAALAALAAKRGASRIRLRVHPENQRARRLYEACGYHEVGIERGELVMHLDLEHSR